MEQIILVVTTVDFAYKTPLSKVVYAGDNANKAYTIYSKNSLSDDKLQVNLDLVQGEYVRRLETSHAKL